MPSAAPHLQGQSPQRLQAIGASIRRRRLELGVSAMATAAAAGISRVTLHRVETGAASVTLGSLMNVLDALDLSLGELEGADTRKAAVPQTETTVPPTDAIAIRDYPLLQHLAWHVQGSTSLRPAEAAGLYARRRRREWEPLLPHERQLITALERCTDESDVPA